ncbi:MAG: hypothetical protein KGN02_02270 [bacterium]|nr:hypothetical protein [bacterium]
MNLRTALQETLPPDAPAETGAPAAAFAQHRSSMGVATALVIAGVLVGNGGAHSPAWHLIVALSLAGLGVATGMISFARYVARWDELQRSIMTVAASTALLGTILVLTINGVLAKHGYPHLAVAYTAAVPIALALIIYPIVRRTYA